MLTAHLSLGQPHLTGLTVTRGQQVPYWTMWADVLCPGCSVAKAMNDLIHWISTGCLGLSEL